MWTAFGLCLLAFSLSVVEEALAARRTQLITARRAVAAANVSALFDAVLFVDVILVVAGYWWLLFPICAGSWLGNWWMVRRESA